jgi:predicted nucleotidyltransferase
MDDNELVDETLSITEALRELWNRAGRNLTTSQELDAISPEQAKAYRLNKEIRDAVKQIKAMEEERRKREEQFNWKKFVRNVASSIVGEIDKSDKR